MSKTMFIDYEAHIILIEDVKPIVETHEDNHESTVLTTETHLKELIES